MHEDKVCFSLDVMMFSVLLKTTLSLRQSSFMLSDQTVLKSGHSRKYTQRILPSNAIRCV